MKADLKIIHADFAVGGRTVNMGRLAMDAGRALFEYDPQFLALGLSVSPFKLPPRPGTIEGDRRIFDGLHGVFADSLPDGWGMLLLGRKLAEIGIDAAALTPLDRLAHVGGRGLGALTYRPEYGALAAPSDVRLDELAERSMSILEGEAGQVLDDLIALGGSPGGARPKVLVAADAAARRVSAGHGLLPPGWGRWLVKFRGGDFRRGEGDGEDHGAVELAYSLMAKEAGIAMPETRLFLAKTGPGYFGAKRFDRDADDNRVHIHTAAGLLHADHRAATLTYDTLLKATRALTRDQREVERMFLLMAFNVLAWNRDDHAKNFSFLMRPDGSWTVSPAYDLVFCAGPGGEHSASIAGEGKNPGLAHMLAAAKTAGIREPDALEAIGRVRAAVSRWRAVAEECGVAKKTAAMIGERIDAACRNMDGKPGGKGGKRRGRGP